MNLSVFGLTRRPFRPTPDTDLYVPTAAAEAAGHTLRAAYDDGDGFALLDGDPGTGKTLVALRFLESLPPAAPRVFVPGARFTRPADLFQAILFDFSCPYQGLSEHELRLAVTEQLLRGLSGGGPTAVVLDEAHHLSPDLLEDVRLLGNLGTRTTPAAFVVLVGPPSVRDRLTGPDAAALAQRVACRPRVDPLTADQAGRYLRHQLRECGGNPAKLLTDEAADLLATGCRGVPRLLNQAAVLAFAVAAEAGEQTLDAEPVLEALERLGLSAESEDANVLPAPPPKKPKRRSA